MAKAQTESPSGLEVGDIVPCSSITIKSQILPGTFVSSTVRAKKGTVLIALLVGEQKLSGEDAVDVVEQMRRMGWQPIHREALSANEPVAGIAGEE